MAGNSLSTVTSHGGRWFMTRVSTNLQYRPNSSRLEQLPYKQETESEILSPVTHTRGTIKLEKYENKE